MAKPVGRLGVPQHAFGASRSTTGRRSRAPAAGRRRPARARRSLAPGALDRALQLGDVGRSSRSARGAATARRRGARRPGARTARPAPNARPPTTASARRIRRGGCGTGAWAGSMRPNFASKPLSGSATYGNVVRNGFSLLVDAVAERDLLAALLGLQQRAGDDAQLDVGDVVGQAAAVREALRCHPRARRSGSGWRSAARRG